MAAAQLVCAAMMGTRTRQARGPRETPHRGADQARRWGWRRTRSEPTIVARCWRLCRQRRGALSGLPLLMIASLPIQVLGGCALRPAKLMANIRYLAGVVRGKLMYAGNVGTGIKHRDHVELTKRFKPLETAATT